MIQIVDTRLDLQRDAGCKRFRNLEKAHEKKVMIQDVG